MGITYIPGPEAQLGPALAQIATAIGDIAKPNARFQQAFQQALATRPELLQQLADVEGRSPGTISKQFAPLIGPELASIVARMTPSLNVRAEQAISPELPTIAQTPTSQLGEVATTPGAIGATRLLTGARPDELAVEHTQAAEAGLRGQEVADAAGWLARQSPAERARLGTYATLEGVKADVQFARQLALQQQLIRARHVDDINNYLLQKQIANASWWQQKTGQGTIDDWLKLFSDQGRSRLNAIQSNGASMSEDDLRLLRVKQAFDQAPAQLRYTQLNAAVDNIRQLIPAIGKADGASRIALIAALNSTLRDAGSDIEARWTDAKKAGGASSLLRFAKLRFFNAQGEEVNQDAALGLIGAGAPSTPRGAAPAAPASGDLERARARAQELQRQGMGREQIRAKLKQEGFNIQ